MKFKLKQLEDALSLLNSFLVRDNSPSFNLIICGGTALIAANLINRTTKDIDILALSTNKMCLINPAPLPDELVKAAIEVSENLNLPKNWINNGPSSGEGGLFQMGLPAGITSRLIRKNIGKCITVFYITRIDQIYFKLYAAVDQFGGYHASDLDELKPTEQELIDAARWSITHDPSEGYLKSMKMFLREFRYENVANRL